MTATEFLLVPLFHSLISPVREVLTEAAVKLHLIKLCVGGHTVERAALAGKAREK